MLQDYFKNVSESASFLKGKIAQKPTLALVLSGGLGAFADLLKNKVIFKSTDIPHFPKARAKGHAGEIVFGEWQGVSLALLKGRYHFYEGLTPQEVVFPYFVLKELGVEGVVSTNAVGGIRTTLKVGDVMAATDQINFMGTNPLIGLAVQSSEEQFPSMQNAFDPKLIAIAQKIAKQQKLLLNKGIYLGTTGPSYETPAEIKAFRKMGADTVGMSTIFEVIACRFLKMRVLALNIVTNAAADRHKGKMNHAEVLQAMQKSEKKVLNLLQGVVTEIAKL